MERPQSIVWFERLYLGAAAVGILNSVVNWSAMQERIAATPNSAMLPSWFVPATMGVGLLITLLLWFFVARRGSVVAKWIVTVLFVIGLIGVPTLITGVSSGLITPLQAAFSLVTFAMNAAAVVMLFRPDAKPWFGGAGRTDLTDTFS
ncbi:hypothetical protein [Sphingomonas sp. SUN039]|uniref:hypothetical protein n=1 Tax=Sphingomonas sp. SUN039 TaxID=2937787 RepID=UPI0021644895|nr:hypothetical protein [Sphingomonas sp. SUN039]UVO54167.1 hypothetical protein M0209_08545 [Sphingomonas sp. SUN039]